VLTSLDAADLVDPSSDQGQVPIGVVCALMIWTRTGDGGVLADPLAMARG